MAYNNQYNNQNKKNKFFYFLLFYIVNSAIIQVSMKANLSQNNKSKTSIRRVKIQTNVTALQPQSKPKQKAPQLEIKVLETKFMRYLNQLNSSMLGCRLRKYKGSNQQDGQQKKTQQAFDTAQFSINDQHKTRSFIKQNKSSQKKRAITKQTKQYTVIEGSKINGKLNGKAILQTSTGSIFKGEVQDGQLKTGSMVFPDGAQYQGGFKNGLFHGQGKMKLKNNAIYITTFTNGIMGRHGQIHYSNGDIYKGQIYQYKKHGVGQLKLKNGNRYQGQFYQGQISGIGTYYVNEFPMAKGRWRKGQFQGNCLSQQAQSSI